MDKRYIEKREGGYWVTGTRVSLDSIVTAFNRGAAPETIKRSFPVLALEEIYGAITYYLAHEAEIDAHLERADNELQTQANARREDLRATRPALYERLKSARLVHQ